MRKGQTFKMKDCVELTFKVINRVKLTASTRVKLSLKKMCERVGGDEMERGRRNESEEVRRRWRDTVWVN